MKWNNDVSDILKIFLSAMAFIGRFDQPMTRGQINRMSEDIDLDKTDRRSFRCELPFEGWFNNLLPSNKVLTMLQKTCLHDVRLGYERSLLYASDRVCCGYLPAVGWNSASLARLPTLRVVGLGYPAPQMGGRMEI